MKKLATFGLILSLFGSQSILASDEADNLALTMLLKKKRFSPKYAKTHIDIGETVDEPYITEDTSLELGKSFLKPVFDSKFNYWKKYYLKNKGFRAESLLRKGSKYKQVVENIFMYHNLPKELYYVGLIESRYELNIKSPAGARGPWQFLASTGREYGLIINRYYDERTNLIKSTHAAAEYFKDLYNIFGSWELALSAYNAGEYGIIRRIRKAGTRSFHQLAKKRVLPKETRNYIPKILALSEIDKKRSKYGINVKKPVHPLGKYENTYVIALKKSHKLRKISKKIGIDIKEIRKLNPELRGYYTPAVKSGKVYHLRLPRPRNQRVIASAPVKSLKKIVKNRPKYHKVQAGENLSIIARKYEMPLAQLMLINEGLEKKTLYPGFKVKLRKPKKAKKVSKKKVVKKSPPKKTIKTSKVYVHHTVKKSETLFSISMLYNVRIKDIKLHNKMNKDSVFVGQKLKIPGVTKTVHVVKKGEFLNKIADQYKTSIESIKKLNSLEKLTIFPGQKLLVLN